jgi:MoaA/NifB/PqqE/SkfB family radical SAM enzyme
LAPRGERLIEECLTKGIPVGIIDNGYTLWRREDLLPRYTHINVSIDGAREAHDRQRGKEGAFRVAWDTIVRLKKLGYDPVVSTAFSPFSFAGWGEFEALLEDNDVPMSVALVLSFPETARRGLANFTSNELVKKGFDLLLGGIPKLINLYGPEYVGVLRNTLNEFAWSPSEDGDSLTAVTPNGSVIHYYPDSLVAASHAVLRWDGEIYFTWGKELLPMKEISPQLESEVRALNRQELALWNPTR